MNIYKITRKDVLSVDEFDSFIITANSPKIVRKSAAQQSADEGCEVWINSTMSTVKLIGKTVENFPVYNGRVILASFNAG